MGDCVIDHLFSLGNSTLNKARSLFLVCLFFLAALIAFNSYSDDVVIEFDGGTYAGEVINGFPHGQGIWTFRDGSKYVGAYEDGKRTGQGTWSNPDGRKYVGAYKDGKRDGQGTWTTPDGAQYGGEFKDNN